MSKSTCQHTDIQTPPGKLILRLPTKVCGQPRNAYYSCAGSNRILHCTLFLNFRWRNKRKRAAATRLEMTCTTSNPAPAHGRKAAKEDYSERGLLEAGQRVSGTPSFVVYAAKPKYLILLDFHVEPGPVGTLKRQCAIPRAQASPHYRAGVERSTHGEFLPTKVRPWTAITFRVSLPHVNRRQPAQSRISPDPRHLTPAVDSLVHSALTVGLLPRLHWHHFIFSSLHVYLLSPLSDITLLLSSHVSFLLTALFVCIHL